MSAQMEGQSADKQRTTANVHVQFVIDPTLSGIKALLDGIAARLPHEAPLAPPRQGQAWQRGFVAGVTQAREVLEWVRDALQLRENAAGVATTDEARHSS